MLLKTNNRVHSKRQQFWKERTLILSLLLIGAALRLWDIGQSPPGLYHDEAQHGLDALYVLDGNTPLYFPANNGREPLFIYLVTASVAFLGRTPIAIRFPSFFIGFLTLAATYDLSRVLWGQRAGRWALAVLAATFWHVHLSRVGFRAVLLPLYTAQYLSQIVRGFRSKRARPWIAAGLLYGASWYTYMAARFTPIALGTLVIYGFILHHEVIHTIWRKALIFCAAALVVLAPLGIYTLQHPDIVLSRTGQVTITHPEINNGDFFETLIHHTLRTAGMFFMRGDRIWRHNLAWRPVWGPAMGLAFVIGVGVALAGFRHNAGAALILLWTIIMALPTLLAEDAPHFLRGVGVLPTAILFPTLGLMWIESQVTRYAIRNTQYKTHFAITIPILLVLLSFTHTIYDYFVRFTDAPEAYHWFEAGPVALAGDINTLRNSGWDSRTMLHGPETKRAIHIERQLWESWSAVSFLTPLSKINFLPITRTLDLADGLAFYVWPYRDWEQNILPYLPHPAYMSVTEGPPAQGDKDSTPFTVAMRIQAESRPDVPEPVARFEGGVMLRAALVQPSATGATVRLWWDTDNTMDVAYTVFVHYLRNDAIIAQHDRQPGHGHLPTTFWQPGDLILDEHPLQEIIPDPAHDSLRIGLYHSETMEGISVINENNHPIGDWAELGIILAP